MSDSSSVLKIREFYETNKTVRNVVIAITILSPFVGLVLSGIVGLLFGLAVGIISYFISPYALTKIREIEHLK